MVGENRGVPDEFNAGPTGGQEPMAEVGSPIDASGADSASIDPLAERTIRLFEFLKRAQLLKSTTVHTTDQYERDGEVLWFADLPEHDAVSSAHRGGDPEPEDVLLTLDRVPRPSPPTPLDDLSRWLDGKVDDPEALPDLRENITVLVDADGGTRQLALSEYPAVRNAYTEWQARWQVWAERERADRPARDLYGQLFSTYVKATAHPEELELVVGVGCLAWRPPEHALVHRHLLTAPVAISFDDDTGRLTVARVPSMDALQVEDDMLDPKLVDNPALINAIRGDARDHEDHPLHRERTGLLVRRLVQTLDARGEYDEGDAAGVPTEDASAAFAPALILRKRSQQGLIDIFNSIIEQIGTTGVVPDGVMPLVDPDRQPATAQPASDGAMVTVDDDPFLPLPVNDKQLSVLRQVDVKAQTLVQGPPGTGKTHTAAVLISHLLAQGKRVLITAHTDQALKEVRSKLPDDIKPLCVAVVGTSREDMSDLQTAVQRIGQEAAEYDGLRARATTEKCLATIDELRRQRAALYRSLIDAREREVVEHSVAGYQGTLAQIAQQLDALFEKYEWLSSHADVAAGSAPPLDDDEINDWLRHLLDERLIADEREVGLRIPDLAAVLTAEQFADLAEAERHALAVVADHERLLEHPVFGEMAGLPPDDRSALQRRLHALADQADELSRRNEAWIDDALTDVRRGRASIWQSRGRQIIDLIAAAREPVDELGQTEVVANGKVAPLVALSKSVDAFLADGGVVRTMPNGEVKIGVFTPKAVKQAQPLFDSVRVNGLPPTTRAQLRAFQRWAEATTALRSLDREWPTGVEIPVQQTLHARLQWHVTEVAQLRQLLRVGDGLEALDQDLRRHEVHPPDWNDLDAIRQLADLVDAAAADDAATAATRPLAELAGAMAHEARWADAAPVVPCMAQAVQRRDHDAYAEAHRRLARLWEVRAQQRRRDDLGSRLEAEAPRLRDTIIADPRDAVWDERLRSFTAAWRWAAARAWVFDQEKLDVNALQARISHADDRIREQVERLAATRAWAHAASPERIGGGARADLQQYATLVRKRGKGTGKYTAKRDADIRRAMTRCRPAVPVWIMPLYRIADQLRIEPDMFDLVVVDEASQAGLDATFLQYLASKIVVIGDDKQVSPAGVGRDQQQLRNLANQFLYDDDYKATWQDPAISLFDQARMRFGGLITLTEHRRCVPEIIGFSNRIAYEPEGIRLVPVRQYGVDRLEPIKAVFLPDGYSRGSTKKLNPVEVDAVVDQIEKCLADPAYDGKTFGVISLLGSAQAKAIEKELLDRIAPEDWAARELRCGDAAQFQGSERDVMFLSMVAAPEPGRRLGALTRDLNMQRFNVAASRAKDQMWVFHSVALRDLGNPDDMRFALLDYCYGVIGRQDGITEGSVGAQVPEGVPVPPFDSLFEQRVCNRLLDRGYTVVPQYPAEGYRIDLVVVGAKGRLAIECDGDAWHGPDAYQRDLARQRDLQRCGWEFFRIRESAFYVDRAAALQPLWDRLDELNIHPSGWVPEQQATSPDAPAEPLAQGQDASSSAPVDQSAVHLPTEPPDTASLLDELPGAEDSRPVTAARIPVEPELPAAVEDEDDQSEVEGAVPHVIVSTPVHDEDRSATDGDPTPAPATAPSDRSGRRGNDDPQPGSERIRSSNGARHQLAPYREFTGSVGGAQYANRRRIIEGLTQIVTDEGPIVGHRLHTVYVKASGGQRVGRQIAKHLNSAISSAVLRGILLEDNPLDEVGIKPCTYRLPEQPLVLPRELGPRPLEQVPPRELAEIMVDQAAKHGWDRDDVLFRAVLDRLGLVRLTGNAQRRLRAVRDFARTAEP